MSLQIAVFLSLINLLQFDTLVEHTITVLLFNLKASSNILAVQYLGLFGFSFRVPIRNRIGCSV